MGGHLLCAGVGLTPRQRGKEYNQNLDVCRGKRREDGRRTRRLLNGRVGWDRRLGRRVPIWRQGWLGRLQGAVTNRADD